MNERIEKLAKQAGYYQAQDVDGSRFDAMPRKSFEKFAELIVRECGELVKARLNHIPDDQTEWGCYNYGETAVVYDLLDTFQEHFGVK